MPAWDNGSTMDSTASQARFAGSTLGGALAVHRLEHRARRLQLVIAVLRERASASSHSGAVPSGLQHAIRDFATELSRVQRRLSVERADDRTARDTSARGAASPGT
jgi:hypothetical protein